jgi:hypothetical protein
MGRNLVLYAMYYQNTSDAAYPLSVVDPIGDTSGSLGPVFSVNVDTGGFTNEPPFVISLQVIGCSLEVSRTKVMIDSTSNHLADNNTQDESLRTSNWNAWAPLVDGANEDGCVVFLPLSHQM